MRQASKQRCKACSMSFFEAEIIAMRASWQRWKTYRSHRFINKIVKAVRARTLGDAGKLFCALQA